MGSGQGASALPALGVGSVSPGLSPGLLSPCVSLSSLFLLASASVSLTVFLSVSLPPGLFGALLVFGFLSHSLSLILLSLFPCLPYFILFFLSRYPCVPFSVSFLTSLSLIHCHCPCDPQSRTHPVCVSGGVEAINNRSQEQLQYSSKAAPGLADPARESGRIRPNANPESLRPDPGAVGSHSWSGLPKIILCVLYTLHVGGRWLAAPWTLA